VLLADAGVPGRRADLPASQWKPSYADMIRALREEPCCVGWHICGAYLKNRVRGYGFRDEQECVDDAFIAQITQANRETEAWAREADVGR
jgi:hypothetical protein